MSTPPPPAATYRVQFHEGFTFKDAMALVDYLADLGVSHLYASPILAARAGSNHGYDVVDPGRLNPDLGSEDDFKALTRKLHERDMGLIVDIVPNHMGVGDDNLWWMDVLEWGRLSPYAKFFDIDWDAALPAPTGKILIPILGSPFGAALRSGEIVPHYDAATGAFQIHYFDKHLPVAPWLYGIFLTEAADHLDEATAQSLRHLAAAFAELVDTSFERAEPRQEAISLRRRLVMLAPEGSAAQDAIRLACSAASAHRDDQTGADILGRLLDQQAYRLSWWRLAADAINYRRFFNINDLAGLRMERGEVFQASHRKILELVGRGDVQGLRIDHIDGLADPKGYLKELQAACLDATDGKAENGDSFYVVVEKIVAEDEELPADWPTAGTTGYEDINLLTRLFLDPAGETPLTEAYRWFTKRQQPFDAILAESKRLIIEVELAGEVSRLVRRLSRVAADDWQYRDFAVAAIRRAVQAVIVHLPVYRTYVDEHGVRPVDRRLIEAACEAARAEAPDFEAPIYDFMIATLSGDGGPEALAIARAFQQVSGPAMAKGLEDTSFYRYFAMIALNEVGGDPRRFAVDIGTFHRAMINRPRQRPHAMIAGSTHDTKRGEDARARLTGLASRPDLWIAAVERWNVLVRDLPEIHGNDAYYIYQSLIGGWPPDLGSEDREALDAFRERLEGALLKALREGKEGSSWNDPDQAYEDKVKAFLAGIIDPAHPFLADFLPVMECFAFWGACTSLSQTLIRLTMPGVPDIYRGSELWELSFVDPDNRRPLDTETLRAGLDSEDLPTLMTAWHSGGIKQALIRRALAIRKELPGIFTAGSYIPLMARGEKADRVVAYSRQLGDDHAVIALTARLWPLLLSQPELSFTALPWGDTAIALPPGRYRDALSGIEHVITADKPVAIPDILVNLPVALLVRL